MCIHCLFLRCVLPFYIIHNKYNYKKFLTFIKESDCPFLLPHGLEDNERTRWNGRIFGVATDNVFNSPSKTRLPARSDRVIPMKNEKN